MTTPTDLQDRAVRWAAEDPDPDTRAELEAVLARGDTAELAERFGSRLEFGTAGLRGILGAGPNRMNRALVRRVTAGLAAYLLKTEPQAAERGVVVAYDGRRLSPEFAEDTAAVLAGAGIPAHVFLHEVPTPVAAYAVTRIEAAAGIMVTASHNPPAYNGYKVYWANGAQIIPPHDAGISAAIDRVGPLPDIPLLDRAAAEARGLYRTVDPGVEASYRRSVVALRRHPEAAGDFPIVYTPLHGVGAASVRACFADAGFSDLRVVPEQAEPDGEFPTVEFPNPEEPGAMDLSLALAESAGADLVLANDPDADRLAVILRDDTGAFRPLTGNEIGTLLGFYLLTENPPPGETLVCTTIVSSGILRVLAADLGARYGETLTGFKWIANRAIDSLRDDGVRFTFGFEEALGYTVGELVRDKDGVGAAVVFADLVAWCRAGGTTAYAYLESVFRRYGLHSSVQQSLTLPGSAGLELIGRMMASLRSDPPGTIGGSPVIEIADVESGEVLDTRTGNRERLDLPVSNVLRYRLQDGSRILVRPSGTEPKIKFYGEIVRPMGETETFAAARAAAEQRVATLIEGFVAEARARVPEAV